jgi:predicted amidohydrolase
MSHHIGLVQMRSTSRLDENLRFAHEQIKLAAARNIDLLAFPETFLFVGSDNSEKHKVAQHLDGEIVDSFRNLAAKYDVSLLLGSIYEKSIEDKERLYNTSLLIDRNGELNGVYRKIHMCDAPNLGYNESDGIKPGNIPVVVDHEIGRVGLTICYDLRFPELYRHLTAQGAQVIFVPAAFFLYTGKHHWIPLLIARAIENQVYIVAPNQWGEHYSGRTSYGGSVIIDPWGSVVCCAAERPEVVSSIIDLNYLKEVRENMPIMTHHRPDVYT